MSQPQLSGGFSGILVDPTLEMQRNPLHAEGIMDEFDDSSSIGDEINDGGQTEDSGEMKHWELYKEVRQCIQTVLDRLNAMVDPSSATTKVVQHHARLFLEMSYLHHTLSEWLFHSKSTVVVYGADTSQAVKVYEELEDAVDSLLRFTMNGGLAAESPNHNEAQSQHSMRVARMRESKLRGMAASAKDLAMMLFTEVERIEGSLRTSCSSNFKQILQRVVARTYGAKNGALFKVCATHMIAIHIALIVYVVYHRLVDPFWNAIDMTSPFSAVVLYDIAALGLNRCRCYSQLNLRYVPLVAGSVLPFALTLLNVASERPDCLPVLWLILLVPFLLGLKAFEMRPYMTSVLIVLLHGAVIGASSARSTPSGLLPVQLAGLVLLLFDCLTVVEFSNCDFAFGRPRRLVTGIALFNGLLTSTNNHTTSPTIRSQSHHLMHSSDGKPNNSFNSERQRGQQHTVLSQLQLSAEDSFTSTDDSASAEGETMTPKGTQSSPSRALSNLMSTVTSSYWLILRPSIDYDKTLLDTCCEPFAALFSQRPQNLQNMDISTMLKNYDTDPLGLLLDHSQPRPPNLPVPEIVFDIAGKVVEFQSSFIALRSPQFKIVQLGEPKGPAHSMQHIITLPHETLSVKTPNSSNGVGTIIGTSVPSETSPSAISTPFINALVIDPTYGEMVIKQCWKFGIPTVALPQWGSKQSRCPEYDVVLISAAVIHRVQRDYVRTLFPRAYILVLVPAEVTATGGSSEVRTTVDSLLKDGAIDEIVDINSFKGKGVQLFKKVAMRFSGRLVKRPTQLTTYKVVEVEVLGQEATRATSANAAVFVRKLVPYPKTVRLPLGTREKKDLLASVMPMLNFTHPNLVSHYGARAEETGLAIFMEYVKGGTLKDALLDREALPYVTASVFTRQIWFGLQALHCNMGYHGDLKADNILIGNLGEVKLTDFCSDHQAPNFRAPETIAPHEVAKAWCSPERTDVWALGCVCLQMIWGRPYVPFSQWADAERVSRLTRVGLGEPLTEIPFPTEYSIPPLWKEFTKLCLSPPQSRPSLEQLLRHDFIHCAPEVNGLLQGLGVMGESGHEQSGAPSLSSLGELSADEAPIRFEV